MKQDLQNAGLHPNIKTTDRIKHPATTDLLKAEQITHHKHDLSKNRLLKSRKQADAVRLAFVLPYVVQEHVGPLVKNAMADVKIGGLVMIGGVLGGWALYEKTSPTHIRLLSQGS